MSEVWLETEVLTSIEPAHVCTNHDGVTHYVLRYTVMDAPGFPGTEWATLCRLVVPEGSIQNRLVGPVVSCLACLAAL